MHTIETLQTIHVTKTFISGAALDDKLRLSGYDDDDVAFQKSAISYAQQVILMIEKEKFPKSTILNVSQLDDIDYIVTDIIFEPEIEKKLMDMNISVINVNNS